MRLLKEIFHITDFDINGKSITREAVRGIILDDKNKKVLMIYSTENGDYKFPGGGVENSEKHEETLIREVNEECGVNISEIESEFGKIIEYSKPREEDFDVFIMTSYYYLCNVDDNEFKNQKLDQYEKDLGFTPVWIDIDIAIDVNNELLLSNREVPRWTKRDTFVLEQVRQEFHQKTKFA